MTSFPCLDHVTHGVGPTRPLAGESDKCIPCDETFPEVPILIRPQVDKEWRANRAATLKVKLNTVILHLSQAYSSGGSTVKEHYSQ